MSVLQTIWLIVGLLAIAFIVFTAVSFAWYAIRDNIRKGLATESDIRWMRQDYERIYKILEKRNLL